MILLLDEEVILKDVVTVPEFPPLVVAVQWIAVLSGFVADI